MRIGPQPLRRLFRHRAACGAGLILLALAGSGAGRRRMEPPMSRRILGAALAAAALLAGCAPPAVQPAPQGYQAPYQPPGSPERGGWERPYAPPPAVPQPAYYGNPGAPAVSTEPH